MSEFLGNGMPADLPEGHPVRVYLDENRLVRELIGKIKNINIQEESENFTKLFKSLRLVEKHFARKENQLFPYLEKYGWTSPSQNMWAFHDQIRDEIKAVRKAIESGDIVLVSQNLAQIFRSLEHLMVVEENRLLPNALNMLSEEDWKEMREGDEEIGWMLDVPPVAYPEPSEEAYIHPSKDTKKRNLPFFFFF